MKNQTMTIDELSAEEDTVFKELASALKALEPMLDRLQRIQSGLRLAGVVRLRSLHPSLLAVLQGQWQIWRDYPELLGERSGGSSRSNPEEDKRADAFTQAESLVRMWKLQQEVLSAGGNADAETHLKELVKPLRDALGRCDALGCLGRPARQRVFEGLAYRGET